MNTTQTEQITQVHAIYIKASPEAVWDAITKPEWTQRYGYASAPHFDLTPGGSYQGLRGPAMDGFEGIPDVLVDGEVIESDPPNRLVQTWRMLMDPGLMAEGFTRLTHEIKATPDGYSKLTIIHDLTGAPGLAALVGGDNEAQGAGGGWAWVLSDLKSLLETGLPLAGDTGHGWSGPPTPEPSAETSDDPETP